MLASRLGVFAVEALLDGQKGMMVGEINGKSALTPLEETWTRKKSIEKGLWRLAAMLAT